MTREEMAQALERHTKLHRTLDAAAAELRKTCAWTPDDDGIFHTGCGHSFYFDGSGGPVEHGQKFCGYCGGNLEEVK